MKIGHGLIAHLNFVCEVYAAGVGSKQSVTPNFGEWIELKSCMFDVWYVIVCLLVGLPLG